MIMSRQKAIPEGSWPRGMQAETAAAYCEVSRTKFLELVEKGVLPRSKNLDGMPRWDRRDLDAAWDALDEHVKRSNAGRKSLDELLGAEDGEGDTALRQ
jgi:hypothetical protein